MATQNRARCSRRPAVGRPGDRSGTRPARADRRRLGVLIATPHGEVLRRPIDFTQYLSIRYTERLAAAGLERSVGTVGDSYDNALAETINGLYKTEVIRRRGPWRNIDAVEYATLEWVDWWNNRRLLEPIGYVPPAEYEATYYRSQQSPAEVAGLT